MDERKLPDWLKYTYLLNLDQVHPETNKIIINKCE